MDREDRVNRVQQQYLARRRKEDLSFLVVRFLRAHVLFSGIYEEFKALLGEGGDFQHAGLFAKIRHLEQTLVFDIKEKAHFLFRSDRQDAAEPGTVGSREKSSIILRVRGWIGNRTGMRSAMRANSCNNPASVWRSSTFDGRCRVTSAYPPGATW